VVPLLAQRLMHFWHASPPSMAFRIPMPVHYIDIIAGMELYIPHLNLALLGQMTTCW
jgi:hypothetical protein